MKFVDDGIVNYVLFFGGFWIHVQTCIFEARTQKTL